MCDVSASTGCTCMWFEHDLFYRKTCELNINFSIPFDSIYDYIMNIQVTCHAVPLVYYIYVYQ